MIKRILRIVLIVSLAIIAYCLLSLPTQIKQPQTFLENKSYQLAKYSRGTFGGVCYQYANRMKKLFPKVKKEYIIIKYRGYDTLTHYRIKLFEDDNLIIYTDSNQKGNQIIRTWYNFN